MLHRQDHQTTIQDLNGKQVELLRVVVNRREGSTDEDLTLALMKIRGGRWHRFFLDVDVLFWQEQERVDPEDLDTFSPDPSVSFSVREIPEARDKHLATIVMVQTDQGGQLTLFFTTHEALRLSCRDAGSDTERTTLEWLTEVAAPTPRTRKRRR